MDIRAIDKENYERSVLWSKQADTRASLVIAFNGALVALLVTENPYTHHFSEVFRGHGEVGFYGGIEIATTIFVFFIMCFVCSTLLALRVVMEDVRRTSCEHNTIFSFINITDISRSEYRKRLHAVDAIETEHAWEDQTYLMAQLARKKIRILHYAWRFLGGAILFAVTFIILTIFFV